MSNQTAVATRLRGNFGQPVITTEKYESFKKEALGKSLLRQEGLLSDLKVLSEDRIEYKGTKMEMTSDAFGSLVKVLGLNKTVMGNFDKALGKGAQTELIDVMRSALASDAAKNKMALVMNAKTGAIVDVRKNAGSVLSNSAFFSLFEDVMNKHTNMNIKRMSVNSNGSLDITAVNPGWEFQVARISDEVFHSGLAFGNNYNKSIISPFTERLICTNGMVVQEKGMSIELLGHSAGDLTTFLGAVRSIADVSYFENEFKGRVNRMANTVASYDEMHHAYTNIKHWLSVEDSEVMKTINEQLPLQDVRADYLRVGLDIENEKKVTWRKAETPMSVWEVANVVTDLASHPEAYGITMRGENTRGVLALQKLAGELAFKKEYDHEGNIPSIFNTRQRIAAELVK